MALLGLLSAFPERPEAVRAQLERVDWDVLFKEAKLHGLSAWLHHAVQTSDGVVPKAHAAQLSSEAFGMAGATLQVKAFWGQVLNALQSRCIQPVLLKGYALGARLYPDPLMRPTSDVDLLISEAELAPASEVMVQLGLRPMEAEAKAYHREHHHHLTFEGAQGMVELHFRLVAGFGGVMDGEGPLSRAQTATLEGRTIRLLSAEDELLYLALHAANHLYGRLSWLYDLKLFTRMIPVDWSTLAERAKAIGMQGPAAITFALLREHLGVPIPAALDAQLDAGEWHQRLERAFSAERLERGYWLDHRWLGFALTTAMATTPLARVRFAGHHTARSLKRKLVHRFPAQLPARWRG
jgi:hypothetical protein